MAHDFERYYPHFSNSCNYNYYKCKNCGIIGQRHYLDEDGDILLSSYTVIEKYNHYRKLTFNVADISCEEMVMMEALE